MRKKELVYNTWFSLVSRVLTILSGFIVPRLVLSAFGSAVNGLVNSISQFLAVISFLELGVGAVVQSALYKPLAEQDWRKTSEIMASAARFFRTIAFILAGYVAVMFFVYPLVINRQFDYMFSASLVIVLSIYSFSQYFFGIVDGLLLYADQRGYIRDSIQIAVTVLNTACSVALIRLGFSIQIVKLSSACIYLLIPICQRLYINRHYSLDRRIRYEGEPIPQKWNGIAQHVAAVVLDGTDSIVLTLFSTIQSVSVYSVYHMVVNGIKMMLTSMVGGFQSVLGELWAKGDTRQLRPFFSWGEWLIHNVTVFVFGCTAVLITPFVSVYTRGITDENYNQVLFGILISCANGMHCLRLPYSIMILAAGHYRQTQSNYITAAAMNVVISILCVRALGLVGVAIGTLVSMVYQTIWMSVYVSRNLVKGCFVTTLKQFALDACCFAVAFMLCTLVLPECRSYPDWILAAVRVALVWLGVLALFNLVFNRDKVLSLAGKIGSRFGGSRT